MGKQLNRRPRRESAGSEGKARKPLDHVALAADFKAYLTGRGIEPAYSTGLGWLTFEGGRWRTDREALRTHRLQQEWSGSRGGLPRQSRSLHAIRQELRPMVHVPADEWDSDPTVLGLPDGAGVLQIGADGPKTASGARYRVTLELGASPADSTAGSLWERCCREWMPRDDVRHYVKVMIGAALLGHIPQRHQVMLYLQSTEGHGKSTFLGSLQAAFGSYALNIDSAVLMRSGGDRHPTEIAQLAGKRLIIAAEVPQGARWDSARVKNLTGGERISARLMRRDFFTFMPRFLIVAAGNFDPRLGSAGSEGMRRRLRMLRWPQRFEGRADPDLASKLRHDLSAVVGWALAGAAEYLRDGLPAMPQSMMADSAAYFEDADWAEAFKASEVVFEAAACCSKRHLFERYRTWAGQEGIPENHRVSMRSLSRLVKRWPGVREGSPRIEGRRVRAWQGLRLRTNGDRWNQPRRAVEEAWLNPVEH